jgi:hypothetical protein
MKKTEYAEAHIPSADEKLQELETGKHDDYELPEFSKEVPVSSRKHESGDGVTMEYSWKRTDSPSIRVNRLIFRSDEDLSGLYRIGARDGADSICFRHNNVTYIARKTAHEIAQALYNAYGKIKGAIENIVGYLTTVLGSDYVISKVEQEFWSFDRRITRGSIHYVDVDHLKAKSRSKLTEMIAEKIAELHAGNVIIGRFTLNNVLLGRDDVTLSDLRKMRVSRKRAYVIEEFKSILQYLFAIGFATREDIYCAIAYYTGKNELSCNEWYQEKTGKKPADQFDLAAKMEEEVYN